MKAPWLKDALIGVSSTPQLHFEGEMGALITKVLTQSIEPALAFGQSIGIWSACRKTALVGENLPGDPISQIGNAVSENMVPFNHPVVQTLARLFEKNSARLLAEAFELLHQTNWRLPSHLIPVALDAGKRSAELRLSLSHVLGSRGTWLAHLNSSWKYAASGVDESTGDNDIRLWEEGNQTQREAFFKNCRAQTPKEARELLNKELSQLPAKERLQFVELMEINLSLEDEPFLNHLLKDRSREVKDKAATLLAQLPESAYTQKIITHMQELITKEKGLIKTSWNCAAPQEFNPEWTALGFTKEIPPSYKVGGERSWWLIQWVRKTPLVWWETYTAMTPKELLQWSKKTDWTQELQQGWIENLTSGNFEWLLLMLQQPPHAKMGNYYIQSKLQQVLPQLPLGNWEKLFSQLPTDALGHLQTLGTIINGLPFGKTLPEKFSHNILDSLKESYQKKKLEKDYRVRYFFQEAAHVLHPNALKTYQPIASEKKTDDEEWLEEIEKIIQLRQTLHKHFTN